MDPAFSVDKLRPALSKALGTHVHFSDASTGTSAELHANTLANGEVLLCENVRYNSGEETNDPMLAQAFAKLGDIYVNDAFSCVHRAHASTQAIAQLLPAYAGPLMWKSLGPCRPRLRAPNAHPLPSLACQSVVQNCGFEEPRDAR